MDMKVSILNCDFILIMLLFYEVHHSNWGGEGSFFFNCYVRAKFRKFQWIAVTTLRML